MVSGEQKEMQLFNYSKITEKSSVITDYWTRSLFGIDLGKDNLGWLISKSKETREKVELMECRWMNFRPPLREKPEKPDTKDMKVNT